MVRDSIRVLDLRGYRAKTLQYDTRRSHWLSDYHPVSLTVLQYEIAVTPYQWVFRLMKQTLKALAIYRRYDLVLADHLATIFPLAFVHSFLHRSRPKLVGIDIQGSRAGPNLIRLFRVAVKSMNAIFCYTTTQRNWWLRNVNYNATFIHLGWGVSEIEVDKYPPRPDRGKAAADIALWSRAEDCGYVFNGGAVSRDYLTLLQATSELRYPVVLVVGYDSMTGMTGLEGAVLSKDVKVYSQIPVRRFLELMSKAKIVALTLLDTPYAAGQLVLLNAMAMGKPIIVTKTPGTIDYVEEGKTVLSVEPGNVTQLKEKILLMSTDVGLRKELGKNAKAKWENEFTYLTMYRKMYEVIEKVL